MTPPAADGLILPPPPSEADQDTRVLELIMAVVSERELQGAPRKAAAEQQAADLLASPLGGGERERERESGRKRERCGSAFTAEKMPIGVYLPT